MPPHDHVIPALDALTEIVASDCYAALISACAIPEVRAATAVYLSALAAARAKRRKAA